jgi:phosphatase NudJ
MQILEAYETPPMGFSPDVEVASCYLESRGRILLLQLGSCKKEVGTWGVPAGKLEKGEAKETAAQRELFEETGISLPITAFQLVGTLYIRKPSLSYVYHLFKVEVKERYAITLSDEHQGCLWASQEDLKVLPLMTGAKEALKAYASKTLVPMLSS